VQLPIICTSVKKITTQQCAIMARYAKQKAEVVRTVQGASQRTDG
jgi:hypothetical protein